MIIILNSLLSIYRELVAGDIRTRAYNIRHVYIIHIYDIYIHVYLFIYIYLNVCVRANILCKHVYTFIYTLLYNMYSNRWLNAWNNNMFIFNAFAGLRGDENQFRPPEIVWLWLSTTPPRAALLATTPEGSKAALCLCMCT